MPVEKLKMKQQQTNFFEFAKLTKLLSPKHKLYKLRHEINWEDLEEWLSKNIPISKLGREKRSPRVMLGIIMLQSMYNVSDGLASETFSENQYWQYFCGYEYVDYKMSVSESSIRRFRQALGEAGFKKILEELTRLSVASGLLKKKDITAITVDTTVQIKNIKHPHDGILMCKAREGIVKLSKKYGIRLKETYKKKTKRSLLKLWRYKADSKSKERIKTLKVIKSRLGRLIRNFDREIIKGNIFMETGDIELLRIIKQIQAQSVLSSSARKAYKKNNQIVYSMHAPEVECIGKGKLYKPYEFGNKVSIACSNSKGFILGVKSFHGNPYDGHTLKQAVAGVEENTGCEVSKISVDLGYRGNNYRHKSKVFMPNSKKKLQAEDKRLIRKRSSIEPIIGHLKQYGRMGRNYLRGIIGDILNPMISAIGFNMRKIGNYLCSRPYAGAG